MRKGHGFMVAALAIGMTAQAAVPPGAPPRVACSASDYRELDFWIGRWRVFDTASGTPVGESRVEPAMSGCALHEQYEAPKAPSGPYAGASYSGFDRKDRKWHQLYVDTNGNVTRYVGGLDGGDMVMTADRGGGAVARMTYRRGPDGSVRQIGQISTDGGRTWLPGYDYTYRPRP